MIENVPVRRENLSKSQWWKMIQVGLTCEPIRGAGERVSAGVERGRHIAVWQRADFVSDITRTFESTSLPQLILSYWGRNPTPTDKTFHSQ